MVERVETVTVWECDGCDRVAEFHGKLEEVADVRTVELLTIGGHVAGRIHVKQPHHPAPPATGPPEGWTRLTMKPLADLGARLCALDRPTRLYCEGCFFQVLRILDDLRRVTFDRVVHIGRRDHHVGGGLWTLAVCGHESEDPLDFIPASAVNTWASRLNICGVCLLEHERTA